MRVRRIRLAAVLRLYPEYFLSFIRRSDLPPTNDPCWGAEAFASFSWVLAHSPAMAFVLLSWGLLGLYIRLQETTVECRAIQALVLSWIGVGLTLPYYGAET
jgi:hypothetical protein